MENKTMLEVSNEAMVNHLYEIFNEYNVQSFIGGSKRFIDKENDSDWDFFIFVGEEIRSDFYKHLENTGFYYNDMGLNYVPKTKQFFYHSLFHITSFNLYDDWLQLEKEHAKIEYTIMNQVGKTKAKQLHKYLKQQNLKGKDFYRIMKILFT